MHLSALFLLIKSVSERVIILAYLDFSRDFHLFSFNISLLTVYAKYSKIHNSQDFNNGKSNNVYLFEFFLLNLN